MPVPVSQIATVASYVLKQKLRGRKRYITISFDGPASSSNYVAAFTLNDQRPITAADADWQGRVVVI